MDKQIENESLSENLLDETEEIVVDGTEYLMRRDEAAQMFEDRQKGAAEMERRANAAHRAVQDYWVNPNQLHRKAALDAIRQCSLWAESEHCLLTVLRLIEFAPPEIFWPALINEWDGCDRTWDHRAWVLPVMKNARKPAEAFFSPSQRQFFETLPPLVPVFRGCSASRVRGIAWTVDRVVAEKFAHGHKGIRVPEPVVASALIPKEHIFFVTDERQEKEVVLNPRRLRKVIIEPFEGV